MTSFKLVYPSKIVSLGLVFLSSASYIHAMEQSITSDSVKDTSLVEALQKGLLERIDVLIAKDGTVIDSELDSEGNTPLHCAAASGQVDIVSFPLTRAAKIDAIDNDQRRETPLLSKCYLLKETE